MKKFLVILLMGAVALGLVACGGGSGNKAIVGTWRVVDTETQTEYGLGIEFTEDGKLRYGLTSDVLESAADGENVEDVLAGLDMLMTIEYEVKSNTEMEVVASALFGLAEEKTTVTYSLDGDTLTFDGATYTRVK